MVVSTKAREYFTTIIPGATLYDDPAFIETTIIIQVWILASHVSLCLTFFGVTKYK